MKMDNPEDPQDEPLGACPVVISKQYEHGATLELHAIHENR